MYFLSSVFFFNTGFIVLWQEKRTRIGTCIYLTQPPFFDMAIIIADVTNIHFRIAPEHLNETISFEMTINNAQQGSGVYAVLDTNMEITAQKDSWIPQVQKNLGTAQTLMGKTLQLYGILFDVNPQTNKLGAKITIKVGENAKTFDIPQKTATTSEKDSLIITAFVFFLPA